MVPLPPTLPMPAHQSYKHHRPAGATSVLGVFSCRVSRNTYIAGGEVLHELRSHPGNERVEVRAFLDTSVWWLAAVHVAQLEI